MAPRMPMHEALPAAGTNLDEVHERGHCLSDLLHRAAVQRSQALLQSGQVLDIVLGLICGLCNLHVNGAPAVRCIGLARVCHSQHKLALLGLELLCDGKEVCHASPPVLELGVRPRLLALLDDAALRQQALRLNAPLGQALLHLVRGALVGRRLRVRRRLGLALVHQSGVGLLELDPATDSLDRLRQHGAELRGVSHELLGVGLLRLAPLLLLHHNWAEQLRHESLEILQGAAMDLSDKDVGVQGLLVHALRVQPGEVDQLTTHWCLLQTFVVIQISAARVTCRQHAHMRARLLTVFHRCSVALVPTGWTEPSLVFSYGTYAWSGVRDDVVAVASWLCSRTPQQLRQGLSRAVHAPRHALVLTSYTYRSDAGPVGSKKALTVTLSWLHAVSCK
eukprot:365498-Chlamydomonas_euryale.AAC.4